MSIDSLELIWWIDKDIGITLASLKLSIFLHDGLQGSCRGSANRNDSSPLRILGRITFKDEEMAVKFEEALVKKGFTRVSTFTPDVIDTYKRYGNDVIFLWQDVR